MSLVGHGIIGLVDDQIRIFHIFGIGIHGRFVRLEPAQYSFDPGHELFGVKWLDHIVIGTKFQTEHLVKNLAFCREHDDRHIGGMTDFPTYLIPINARQHQIQKDQVWLPAFKGL